MTLNHTRLAQLARHLTVAAVAALASTALLAETRTVDTAFGTVEIEGTPERIVTLYEGALDAAIAVGAEPLGAVITRGGTAVADYIQPLAEGISIVGAPGETNLEAVLALQPDIILAPVRTNQQQYTLLSAIAPTIVPDVPAFQSDSWIRETRLFAKALGREKQGEAAIDKVKQRIDEVARLVEANVPEDQRDAAVVRWMPQGALVMTPGIFSATLLKAVGFQVSDAGLVEDGRPHSHPLSEESLSAIDQSWLFLATLNSDGQEALDAAKQSPAFGRLQAVENDRVVLVDGQEWTSATGPLVAEQVLDAIEKAISGGRP